MAMIRVGEGRGVQFGGLSLIGWLLGATALSGAAHAQAERPPTQSPPADAAAAPVTSSDIVVTAQRRSERVLDVPYNISVVTADRLARSGTVDLRSLGRVTPGLTIADTGARAGGINNTIIIRGLNVNSPDGSALFLPFASVPLVTTYVDDVPLFVDLRLKDIARVEVLRGPQGTLYGSGAVGGTLRFIFNEPDPTRTYALFSGDVAATDHSASASYSADGVINLPLGERAAVRIAGGYSRTAGFINASNAAVYAANGQPVLADPANPLTSGLTFRKERDIDRSNVAYVRAQLLWNATDTLKVKLLYQHQHSFANGFSAQTVGQDYTSQALIPDTPEHRTVDLGAITVSDDLGFATLSSTTSYSVNRSTSIIDDSEFIETYDSFSPTYYGNYPRITSPFSNSSRDTALTQEVRLVSKKGDRFDYVLGAYLQEQHSRAGQVETLPGFAAWSHLPGSADAVNALFGTSFPDFASVVTGFNGGTDPAALSPVDTVYTYNRHSRFNDKAIYGELTYHLSHRWQVTGGFRVFWQKYRQTLVQTIPLCGPFCSTLPVPDAASTSMAGSSASFHDHIFKANTSYALGRNLRAYATFSQGFRHGGANASPIGDCVFCDASSLARYDADRANNYEVGLKGSILDRRLDFTAALYRIDWKNIQLQLAGASGDPVVVNGGRARSQGVELEVTARPAPRVTIEGGYSYADSKLRGGFLITDPNASHPNSVLVNAQDGDRLPFVPRHQLNGGIDYDLPIGQRVLTMHVDAAYRSKATTALNASARGYTVLSGFTTVSASLTLPLNDRVTMRLVGTNLTNTRGVVAGGALTNLDPRYSFQFVSRPRTIGLGVDVKL